MNVPSGYTALDMVGFTDKGVYNASASYVKNDIVHYGGNLWRCKVDDTTATTPTEGASWTIFLAEPSSAAEDIIAPVETTTASTRQYAEGDQLIYNDTLYTVTQDINIGDTLTVNTNIEASDSIVEQLDKKANASDLGTAAAKDSTNAVTSASTDLVESGAVYTGLAGKADKTNIAPVESGATASQAYAIGDEFYLNGTLYKAKVAIASGATLANLVLNTDYEAAPTMSSQMQTLANKANNKVLYLTSVACSATTGNFVSLSNAAITADHVLAECVFANPSAITTDVSWSTGAGSLTLNGTCTSATTANIVLVKKDN